MWCPVSRTALAQLVLPRAQAAPHLTLLLPPKQWLEALLCRHVDWYGVGVIAAPNLVAIRSEMTVLA